MEGDIQETRKQKVRFKSGIVENQHGPVDNFFGPFGHDAPPDPLGYVIQEEQKDDQ